MERSIAAEIDLQHLTSAVFMIAESLALTQAAMMATASENRQESFANLEAARTLNLECAKMLKKINNSLMHRLAGEELQNG